MSERAREAGRWAAILTFAVLITALGLAAAGWIARNSCCIPTQDLARDRVGVRTVVPASKRR